VSENSANESIVVEPGLADTGESSFIQEGESSEIAAGVPARAPVRSGSPRARSVPATPSPAPSAPAQTIASSPRPSKGTVVLAIGLPGSGKSSWFKRHNIHPLSSDLLRELLFDDPQEQRFQDLIFSNLRSMLKARLVARRPMNYVDATNLTPHDRHSWIKLAKDYGYDVQGVFFDVPLDVCMERHQRRGRAVPEDVMRKMAGKLRPPTFEEGFSKITVVRVKQKDKE
jgi:predicted kinase